MSESKIVLGEWYIIKFPPKKPRKTYHGKAGRPGAFEVSIRGQYTDHKGRKSHGWHPVILLGDYKVEKASPLPDENKTTRQP